MTCFAVMVVAISFVLDAAQVRQLVDRGDSTRQPRSYIQAIFTPLTRNTGKTAWYIDEFGAVLPLVSVVSAIHFWTKRRELPAP